MMSASLCIFKNRLYGCWSVPRPAPSRTSSLRARRRYSGGSGMVGSIVLPAARNNTRPYSARGQDGADDNSRCCTTGGNVAAEYDCSKYHQDKTGTHHGVSRSKGMCYLWGPIKLASWFSITKSASAAAVPIQKKCRGLRKTSSTKAPSAPQKYPGKAVRKYSNHAARPMSNSRRRDQGPRSKVLPI